MNSVEILSQAAEKDNLTHAYLAPVRSGTELNSYAAELGKTILCPPDTKKCTQRVMRRAHPDFHLVTVLNDNRKISISQVDEIISSSSYSPVEAEKKVYAISRAEDLSREGSNSLLKILEDPPDFVYFLLLTEGPNSLLPTIISRCQQLPVGGASIEGARRVLSGKGFDKSETDYLMDVINRKANLLDKLLEESPRSPLEFRKEIRASNKDSDLTELSEEFIESDSLIKRDVIARLIFESLDDAENFQLISSAGKLKGLSHEELSWLLEKGIRVNRESYRRNSKSPGEEGKSDEYYINLEQAKLFDRALDSLRTNANLQLLLESLWLQLRDVSRSFNEPKGIMD